MYKCNMFHDSLNLNHKVYFLFHLRHPALFSLFFKIITYMQSANFSGNFGFRVHHTKRSVSSCLQNVFFFKFEFRGAASPPPLSAPLWHPISVWASLICLSHVRLDLAILYALVYHACHKPRPFHPYIQWTVQSLGSSFCKFLHQYVTWSVLAPNIPLNTPFSNTLSLCFPSKWRIRFHNHTKVDNTVVLRI